MSRADDASILVSLQDGVSEPAAKVEKSFTLLQAGMEKLHAAAAKLVGGGGGGRETLARAGGRDPAKLPEAIAAAEAAIA